MLSASYASYASCFFKINLIFKGFKLSERDHVKQSMGLYIRFEFHIFIHREDGKRRESQPQSGDEFISPEVFCRQAEEEITKQQELMTRSTVDNYQTALRSFRKFREAQSGEAKLDGLLLKRYERWLGSQNLKPNTVSCYLRSLRSLLLKIYGEGKRHLFDKVYTGMAATDKRSLPIDDIARLKAVKLPRQRFLSLVRDLFLFSFYALGMPFVDMAFLRRQQISDGQLTYYRHKTGQPVTVKIEPCMQEILDRYQSCDREYVFPLLKSTDQQRAYQEYKQMLNRYNRSLKQLSEKAGVKRHLTSYVSRHTWASTAYQENVDLAVISKALGHANPHHTMIYIRQIDDQRLNEANHHLIDSLSHVS